MKSQYEKDYDNLLQALRDKEDEIAQKARKAEKAKLQRLRDLTRALQSSIRCLEAGVPQQVIISTWKKSPTLKPIGDFLFPDSK